MQIAFSIHPGASSPRLLPPAQVLSRGQGGQGPAGRPEVGQRHWELRLVQRHAGGRGVGRQHEQERVDVEEGVSPKSYPLLASQAALTRNQGVCKRREGIEGKKPRRKAGGSGEKEENLANE